MNRYKSRPRDRPPVETRVCRAIRLLAEGKPPGDVAQQVRILPATLAAWQESGDFQALLACLSDYGRMRFVVGALRDLTPDAIAALRRALTGPDTRWAVQAAQEVLNRLERLDNDMAEGGESSSVQTIRVEYVNREGHTVSTTPWADRHPASPGTLQGGGLRSPLREDRDGQDSADRAGAGGPDRVVDQPDVPHG
ncbi:MAG: hypothetical protein JW966_04680 [Anaerolineae bacterium]|nr:hypothetical protein [Anaerolineae bacterium]